MIKRIAREPILHFLLMGAALFAAFAIWPDAQPPQEEPTKESIVVPAAKVEHLAMLFLRTNDRPPSPDELRDLVDDFVREEIAYREGKAMGIDDDDTIIRERIREKLEFVAAELTEQTRPTDEQLAAFLEANADDYRAPPRLTFRHLYLDPEKRGRQIQADAKDIIAKLNRDETLNPPAFGDATKVEYAMRDVSPRRITRDFGRAFAEAIVELPARRWAGPIASDHGWHIIHIDERKQGRLPPLEEIRTIVERDWQSRRGRKAIDAYYDARLREYDVTIEWPEPADAEGDP